MVGRPKPLRRSQRLIRTKSLCRLYLCRSRRNRLNQLEAVLPSARDSAGSGGASGAVARHRAEATRFLQTDGARNIRSKPSAVEERAGSEPDDASIEPLVAATPAGDSFARQRAGGQGKQLDEVALTRSLAEFSSRLRQELIIAGSREPLRLCNAIIELSELRDHILERRRDGLQAVQTALSSLRENEGIDAVLARATAAVCESCGFDRAMLSRVEDSRVAVHSVSIPRNPALAAEILAFSETVRRTADQQLVETERLRGCRPTLVRDAQKNAQADREFAALTGSTAYVAAPIISDGHVVGCLHADLYYSARDPDEVDRDRLLAFAEGLGCAVDRAALHQRLRQTQSDVRHPTASTEMPRADDRQTEAENVAEKETHAGAIAGADPSTLNSNPPTDPLTPREHEVLELMSQGATNGVIGDRLVISAATVKSHVGHILRKLNARNRTEAVSRYLGA
jgi:LuxR family transcriptional regulator, regulator of acetate metabolism